MARGRKAINPQIKYFNTRLCVAKGREVPKEVTITGTDCYAKFIEQKGRCAISGEKLTFEKSGSISKRTYTNASIDRIDNDRGYHIDNIQIVSVRMNSWKSNLSLTKFKKMIKMINRHTNGKK